MRLSDIETTSRCSLTTSIM